MGIFAENGNSLLGLVFDSITYGFHCAIFAFFVGIHRHHNKKFYSGVPHIATIILFVLCTFTVVIDTWESYELFFTPQTSNAWEPLGSTYTALYALIDFTSQMALIYRCWIIWSRNYYVVILPALVALATLASEFALVVIPNAFPAENIPWTAFFALGPFSFAGSMITNAVITILTVYRIWKVAKELEEAMVNKGKPYRLIVAILLESGLILLLIQTIWLILWEVGNEVGFPVVSGAITQIYGFIPTVLLCRAVMGATYERTNYERELGTDMQFAPTTSMQLAPTTSMQFAPTSHPSTLMGLETSAGKQSDTAINKAESHSGESETTF
ncbi:hypothetical protein M422DRAFT_269865 [Sphaerobolus stellatus SS14]|uniref:Uncharacterized protein n=1 Tax=Sphaerobolus stellatus (strain SS14) TaxID=990650 RepID=A0A0C9U3P0_SPHS4|nr:hypothetical protein M422DRAFT_269865 [Sphaerobolus stellatus SS14]